MVLHCLESPSVGLSIWGQARAIYSLIQLAVRSLPKALTRIRLGKGYLLGLPEVPEKRC